MKRESEVVFYKIINFFLDSSWLVHGTVIYINSRSGNRLEVLLTFRLVRSDGGEGTVV